MQNYLLYLIAKKKTEEEKAGVIKKIIVINSFVSMKDCAKSEPQTDVW